MERSHSVTVLQIGPSALAQQIADPGEIAIADQHVQRALTHVVLGVDDNRSGSGDERNDFIRVAILDRLDELGRIGQLLGSGGDARQSQDCCSQNTCQKASVHAVTPKAYPLIAVS